MAAVGRINCLVRRVATSRISTSSNKLLQRRAVASLSSALLRKETKLNTFQSTYIAPVNKFDLSSGGDLLLNAAVAHFSTAFDGVQTDDLSEDDIEETTMANKWPSPVAQIKQACSIFIGGDKMICNELEIAKLFSKFGKVIEVDIPLKQKYLSDDRYYKSYKYAFVTFEDEKAMTTALEGKTMEYDDNGVTRLFDIKEKTTRSDYAKPEKERTLVISNLPTDVTVAKLYEYVKAFGNVELINLILNESLLGGDKRNYAYVLFSSPKEKENALQGELKFENAEANISQNRRRLSRDRSRKLMLEQFTESLSKEAIQNHLKSYGDLVNLTMLTEKSGEFRGIAIAEFSNTEDILKVTESMKHNIDGEEVLVRAMGGSFISA